MYLQNHVSGAFQTHITDYNGRTGARKANKYNYINIHNHRLMTFRFISPCPQRRTRKIIDKA